MKNLFPGKILLTTDFSQASYTSFPYALDLAKSTKSSINLVNAVGFPPIFFSYEYFPSQEEIEELKEKAKSKAIEKIKSISKEYFSEISVEETVLEGSAWAADLIVDYAEKEKIGLIIISTLGHGFIDRFFFGSVAERILRQATCPVLIVPSRLEDKKMPATHLPVEKIVLTTDFSKASELAFSIAEEEATRRKAKLNLLHVIEDPYINKVLEPSTLAEDQTQRLNEIYLQGIEKKLNDYTSSFKNTSASYRLIPKIDSVASSIIKYLKDEDADLLIISSKGKGNRLNILGGTIEHIVRESPCPVLVVPKDGNS